MNTKDCDAIAALIKEHLGKYPADEVFAWTARTAITIFASDLADYMAAEAFDQLQNNCVCGHECDGSDRLFCRAKFIAACYGE